MLPPPSGRRRRRHRAPAIWAAGGGPRADAGLGVRRCHPAVVRACPVAGSGPGRCTAPLHCAAPRPRPRRRAAPQGRWRARSRPPPCAVRCASVRRRHVPPYCIDGRRWWGDKLRDARGCLGLPAVEDLRGASDGSVARSDPYLLYLVCQGAPAYVQNRFSAR